MSHLCRWIFTGVVIGWASLAAGEQITDTFGRPDDTNIGSTETPGPGLTYVERGTTGNLIDVAAIVSEELHIYGDGGGLAGTSPGQVILEVEAADLDISVNLRFQLENPAQACANNSAGFLLRKPLSDADIGAASGARSSVGQIIIQMTPAGGLYVTQKNATGTNTFDVLFLDNPWVPGMQTAAQVNVFQGAGALPAAINGQPFDADGDGVLEGNEPFRIGASLHGTSLSVLINDEAVANVTVTGTGNSPHNYFSVFRNRWTGNAACAPSLTIMDDLEAAVVVPNDTCEGATPVSAGTTLGTTLLANPSGGAACGDSNPGADLWYSYTASESQMLVVDTCGSEFDTVVSVYDGCGGTEVACNNDFCGTGSRVTAAVVPGNQYLIRVAGSNGAAGAFVLHVADGTPANDDCANATPVEGGAIAGTTMGATSDGTASCDTASGGGDVWYRYTATCTAPLEVNTCGSASDTLVAIYADACGGNELACNDDGCGLQSRAETAATQGSTYLIRVAGAKNRQGDFVLNVLCKVPPPNDLCGSAIAVTEGVTEGTTIFATSDGDALCGSSAGSPDVWYTFTSPRSGRLRIEAGNASYAAAVSVHSGCPATIDNQIACGTPITLFTAQQNVPYLIRVAGSNGASGTFHLGISYDNVVIRHEGQNNPLTEGWTRDSNSAAMQEGAGNDGKPHWFLTQIDTARLNYQFTGLTASDFADPDGWTMSAAVKAVTSPTQWQTHILLQDGQDTWAIHLIDGTGTLSRGLYLSGATLADADLLKVSDLDPTADYHLYQISYNPKTQVATFAVDNVLLASLTRDQVVNSTLRRLVWGDNSSTGGASSSRWNLVQFEFGAQALACHKPAADADGDGDVDQSDFGALQVCFTGGAGSLTDECRCYDFDSNNFVDGEDVLTFGKCASGPTVAADPDCAD